MRRAGPILIIVIGLLAILVDFVRVPLPSLGGQDAGTTRYLETKLGLDLQGGLRIEYQVSPAEGKTPTRDDLARPPPDHHQPRRQVGRRGAQVVVQGNDRIVVEMPGIQNADQIRSLVGTTGRLDFVPLGSLTQPPGRARSCRPRRWPRPAAPRSPRTASCSPATRSPRPRSAPNQTGQRTVDFTLQPEGKDLFAAYTAEHTGDIFAIVLDGKIISAPSINEPIPGGQVQISQNSTIGGYPLAAAQNLVTVLQFGQLPFPIQELANTTVSPTLGEAFLHQSLIAGLIAILMVIFFMVVHYRLPGVVASVALIFYALLVLRPVPADPGHDDAGRRGGLRALGGHGGRRQHPDLRAHEGGAAGGQEPAGGDRGGLQPRLELDPRLQRVEPDHRA